TIEAKEGDQTFFLVELQQAGLFHIAGYDEDEFKAIVGSYCPNILFPYARESIANMVSKGGFPEFLLQPINFDALYAEGMKQAQAKAAE
ncbi:MAG: protein-export chaperone SecB, partial [Burkholderiales bacterium]|nr:protein-export chaperone SecB [Burkholderiales bacterium]